MEGGRNTRREETSLCYRASLRRGASGDQWPGLGKMAPGDWPPISSIHREGEEGEWVPHAEHASPI